MIDRNLGILIAWSVVAVLAGIQEYAINLFDHNSVSALESLLIVIPPFAIWAAFTPVIFETVKRWPVDTRPLSWLPHVLVGTGFVAMLNLLVTLMMSAVGMRQRTDNVFTTTLDKLADWGPQTVVFYLFVVLVVAFAIRRSPGPAESKDPSSEITLNVGKELHRVSVRSISRVEARRDYSCYRRIGGADLLVRQKLSDAEERLVPFGFVRVHRSFLINPGHVSSLNVSTEAGPRIRLSDGSSLPVARSRLRMVKDVLQQSVAKSS